MLDYSRAFYELKNKLLPMYDEREAAAIAHGVLQHITGLDRMQRLLQKDTLLTEAQQQQYEQMSRSLLSGKPLQYVTGSAWFMRREFYVNEHVLIPRPETEELIDYASSKFQIPNSKSQIPNSKSQIPNPKINPPHILDVGTGSGCIAISLKLALPGAIVTACDISKDALAVAKENANRLQAEVTFMQLDFLDAHARNNLGSYDVIVSNPPYIPVSEKASIHTNVKDHEPGIALFVPDEDALVFYAAIAAFGREHLKSNGYIYCEIHAALAAECKALFENAGYEDVEVRKDMHGNMRMLACGIGNW